MEVDSAGLGHSGDLKLGQEREEGQRNMAHCKPTGCLLTVLPMEGSLAPLFAITNIN